MLADVVQLAVESQVALGLTFDAAAISADVSKAREYPPSTHHLLSTTIHYPWSTIYDLLLSTIYYLLSTIDYLQSTTCYPRSTIHYHYYLLSTSEPLPAISKAISWVHISGTMHDLVAAG